MRPFAWLSIVVALVAASPAFAEDAVPFETRTLSTTLHKDVSLRYYLHFPKNYGDGEASFPLLVYLHGGMGRGDEFRKLAWYPIPRMIVDGSFPDTFIVLVPQCPPGRLWTEETDEVASMIDEIATHYRVDRSRIYGIGYSMGGNGIVFLTYTHPKLFAAIAAMSGTYNTWWVTRIKDVPAWFFHGAKDDHVDVNDADRMVEQYRREGGDPRYTRDPEGVHRPPSMEDHLEVLRWLLEHRSKKE